MKTADHDSGVMMTVIRRLNHRRVPRVLALKQHVDAGAALSDYDISFLERVLKDAGRIKPYIDRNQEYRDIYVRLIGLYLNIVHTALENENKD
ncbi:MAG: hypothetical protein OQK12_03965 [Motiliproteus sp.]|nr:hypothetical protein [Motiliproteus sp.]MCW9052066.1 hypothetical protein [Motiliproteus sp.]